MKKFRFLFQIFLVIIIMFLIRGCFDMVDKKEQKTISLADGSHYSGEVTDNIPNGQGVLTSKDGFIYTGDFKKGEFIKGTRSHKDYSDIATGEFKNGVLHGEGEMHTQEGGYKGHFKNGVLYGYGYYETGSSGDRFIGTYENGVLIGKATIEFGNGDKYVGELENDFMHGTGTLTYADGRKYVGEFKDGKPTGNGKYLLADGSKSEISLLSGINLTEYFYQSGAYKYRYYNGVEAVYDQVYVTNINEFNTCEVRTTSPLLPDFVLEFVYQITPDEIQMVKSNIYGELEPLEEPDVLLTNRYNKWNRGNGDLTEVTAAGQMIVTPAGSFNDCIEVLTIREFSDGPVYSKDYYAKGFGLVKSTIKDGMNGEYLTVSELIDHKDHETT